MQNNSGTITLIVNIPLVLVIGVLFDTVGRKKPYLIALVLALAYFTFFPICKSIILYYVLNAILKPLFSFIHTNKLIPFVPDLI